MWNFGIPKEEKFKQTSLWQAHANLHFLQHECGAHSFMPWLGLASPPQHSFPSWLCHGGKPASPWAPPSVPPCERVSFGRLAVGGGGWRWWYSGERGLGALSWASDRPIGVLATELNGAGT